MTARLGIVGKRGLGEALRGEFKRPLPRLIAIFLVLSAIVIGNAAYETSNILGASLGMIELSGVSKINFFTLELSIWGPIIGIIAFLLLIFGTYKSLERILITLVLLMSVSFITTAIIIGPELQAVFKGMFVPQIPTGSLYMLIGLIGTTVVPYNLFLHASTVQEKWKAEKDLSTARYDLFFSVILGGLISMSIVITAATAFYGNNAEIKGVSDLASQLKPLLGNWAGIFMSVGLFAAGISSAITAPLAAAYAASGILGWKINLKSMRFKAVWMIILLIGIVFSAIGFSPIKARHCFCPVCKRSAFARYCRIFIDYYEQQKSTGRFYQQTRSKCGGYFSGSYYDWVGNKKYFAGVRFYLRDETLIHFLRCFIRL